MHAARAQPGEMPLADQQPGRRGLLLLRERTSQRIALLPGARAHCISVGRLAAQQRGCVSIPPQPRRREVPANSICRAATGSSERCHASDQWRKRPRPAGWVTARLLSHLEAERLSPIVPAARTLFTLFTARPLVVHRKGQDATRTNRSIDGRPIRNALLFC